MLALPSRSTLRARPIAGRRIFLSPLDGLDTVELWESVEGSRVSLERFLPWVPFQSDVESSRGLANASGDDWDAGRSVRFGLRERSTSRFIGVVSLENFLDLHRSAELGYWLRDDATGRGYMTEGAAVCLEWGFRVVGLHRVRVAAAADNHRSLRVIERLGFKPEGVAREAEWCAGRWLDHAVFALLEDEWRCPW
jgi:ribosomal-protein-serine acetyltransferase